MRTKTTSARTDQAPEILLHPDMSPAEIYAAYGLTCPPRVGTLRDPSRPTYGRAVARVMARLGMPPMPAQRYAVDVALEVDPQTQALAYRDITILKPRQSGKTTLILGLKSHRAMAFPAEVRKHAPHQRGRQRILYAAQTRNAAREKWEDDHLPVLEASPYASRFRKRMSNGHEALIWAAGAIEGITSNTETASHGKILDLGIEDEFFAAEDPRLEQAFSPAMITRWSPQHWRISTEGTEKSLYLASKVDTGRAAVESGARSSICYLEWSNLDGQRDDPATWLTCMPALCPQPGPGPCRCDPAGRWRHTVTIDTIQAELEKMASDPDDFDRAYLNRRRGSKLPPDPNIPTAEEWLALADPRAVPGNPVAFAIEMTFDRRFAAIVAVGPHQDDARRAIEVIDHRPDIDWLIPRVLELNEKWKPVAWGLAVGGPAGALVQPLADAGIVAPTGDPERGQLWIPTSMQLGASCGAIVDGTRQKTLAHRDDPRLNDALASARTRPMGDTWMFARKASGDICCLVAATVALGAYEARKYLDAAVSTAPATAPSAPAGNGGRDFWRPTRRLNL
jgi:hypothetical protein